MAASQTEIVESHKPSGASRDIASHLARVRFDDLPADAVAATKRRIIDLVGCAIGGARAEGNDTLVAVLERQGQAQHASLLGQGGKLCAADAAMANAITARSYDFEVMSTVVAGKIYPSHTSPTTVTTAFAMAEREDRSGADFLTALTLGDDLVARLLGGAGFDFGQGWDAASVHSGVGAAAIAAKLLGLGAQGITDAMGMSVNLVGGTIQAAWDGSTDFKLPQGMAARHGILCAELAEAGWSGLSDPFFSPYGFYRQFTSGCRHPEVLTGDLGRIYYAEEYFKPYPACAATHSAIECALALRERPGFDIGAAERITVRLAPQLLTNFCIKPYEPRRFPHCDAIFSYRFQVANALLNGETRQDHYGEAALREPALVKLAARIDLEPMEPDGNAGGSAAGGRCRIEVAMADGGRIAQDLERLRRHPATRPSTDAEVEAKFMQQFEFAGRTDMAQAEAIIAHIRSLEESVSIRELVLLITQG